MKEIFKTGKMMVGGVEVDVLSVQVKEVNGVKNVQLELIVPPPPAKVDLKVNVPEVKARYASPALGAAYGWQARASRKLIDDVYAYGAAEIEKQHEAILQRYLEVFPKISEFNGFLLTPELYNPKAADATKCPKCVVPWKETLLLNSRVYDCPKCGRKKEDC